MFYIFVWLEFCFKKPFALEKNNGLRVLEKNVLTVKYAVSLFLMRKENIRSYLLAYAENFGFKMLINEINTSACGH